MAPGIGVGVLICIQEAGLVHKVTAEQVPTLAGNDACSLHVLQLTPVSCTHPRICQAHAFRTFP